MLKSAGQIALMALVNLAGAIYEVFFALVVAIPHVLGFVAMLVSRAFLWLNIKLIEAGRAILEVGRNDKIAKWMRDQIN